MLPHSLAGYTTYHPPRRPSRGIGHWVPYVLAIEPAIAADIPVIVSLICDFAPWIDPRFDSLFPRRTRFPGDFRQFVTDRLQEFLSSGRHRVLSAVIRVDGKDPRCGCGVARAGTVVVGFAVWERVGGEKLEEISGFGSFTRAVRMLVAAVVAPLEYNLAVDHDAYARYVAARDLQDAKFAAFHADHWRLHAVVVNPRWRAWGIGSRLASWGLNKAREEGVAVLAETTPDGEHCEEMFVRLRFHRFGTFMPTVNGVNMGTCMRLMPWMWPPPRTTRIAKMAAAAEENERVKRWIQGVRTKADVCTCFG